MGKTKPNTSSSVIGAGATPIAIHSEIKSPSEISFETERAVNTAICDYFMKLGLVHSFNTFSYRGSSSMRENLSIIELLRNFDEGNEEEFFERWNLCTNIIFTEGKNSITYNLEFYLRIHFTAYSIEPTFLSQFETAEFARREYLARLEYFKAYLEELKNIIHLHSPETLGYFAMPYVENIEEHPSFRHIFTPTWIQNLRKRVIAYLHHYLGSGFQIPHIFKYYEAFKHNRLSPGYSSSNQPKAGSITDFENNELISHAQHNSIHTANSENHKSPQHLRETNSYSKDLLIKELQTLASREQEKNAGLSQTLVEQDKKWSMIVERLLNISEELLSCSAGKLKITEANLIDISQKLRDYRVMLQKWVEVERNVVGYSQSPNEGKPPTAIKVNSEFVNEGGFGGDGLSVEFYRMDNEREEESIDESTSPMANYPGVNQSFDDEELQSEQAAYISAISPLDYDKIRKFLGEKPPSMNESSIQAEDLENKKCMVLKALRLRLIQVSGAHEYVRMAYIYYNLLGMSDESDETIYLLLNSSRGVMGHTMSLLNTIANDSSGRTYILQYNLQKLIKTIVQIYIKEKGDTSIRENSIGLLQKLSLRPECEIELIDNNMILEVANVLAEESDTLSEYSLEYTTAMLMNLALRSKGKIKCEEINVSYMLLKTITELNLIKILSELMANENLQVRSYVNGTLYSILTREKLQQKAKEIDLEHMLKELKEHSNKQFLKEIEYILEQLETPPNDDTKSDQDDFNDDANEDDEFDPEIQENITEEEHKEAEDLLLSDFSAPQELANEYFENVQRFMEIRRQNRKVSVHESINDESGMIVGGASMSGLGGRISSGGGIVNTSQTGGEVAVGGINSSSIIADGTTSERPKVRPATPGVKMPSVPMDQPDEERKLPSELESRPKIPRTPIGGKRPPAQNNNNIPELKDEQGFKASPFDVNKGSSSKILDAQQQQPQESENNIQGENERAFDETPILPKIDAQEEEEKKNAGKKNAMTETQMNSFKEAFTKRDKLARTPPSKKNKIASNSNYRGAINR